MRIYEQAIETCQTTNPKSGDIIQPFNYKKLDGVCPTITTRPEGLKTMILIMEKIDDNNTMQRRR